MRPVSLSQGAQFVHSETVVVNFISQNTDGGLCLVTRGLTLFEGGGPWILFCGSLSDNFDFAPAYEPNERCETL